MPYILTDLWLQRKTFLTKVRTYGIHGVLTYLARQCRKQTILGRLRTNARRYPLRPTAGITVIASLAGNGSLNKVARDLVIMLKRAGIPVQTYETTFDKADIPPSAYEGLVTPPADFRIMKYDHVIEVFTDYAAALPLNHARLAFWEFESGFLECHPQADDGRTLLAMSDFDLTVFRNVVRNGTRVCKLLYPFFGIPPDLPPADALRARFGIEPSDFAVFFNFDLRSSFNRKNPDGVLRAFAEAFRDVPGAKLVFKVNGASAFPEKLDGLGRLAAELGVPNQCVTVSEYLSQRDLYGLTNACDVYISLHRGEGFGLGIAEAMSLGKPVIVTDYSAPTEFCREGNSIRIPFKLVDVEPAQRDHDHYAHVRQWAEPDIHAAARALRRLHDDPALRQTLGANAKAFVARRFSVGNFRTSVMEFLSRSGDERHPPRG